MVEFGYWLSSEENGPRELVRNAVRAEEAGFSWAMISDHFHPWVEKQGQSPFVWSVIAAIGQATERLRIGTGVTCPFIRTHPAIIAQAAATTEALMPGRFFLGVGTGENLNEHVTGQKWPPYRVRAEMLRESVEIIRLLWQGGLKSYYGKHLTLENTRLYTLPDQPPPIMMAAAGPKSTALAAEIADGLINSSPQKEVVDRFDQAGGKGRPKHGECIFCWAPTKEEALKTAHEYSPMSVLGGNAGQELPLPSNFEGLVSIVTEEQIAEAIVHGSDPEPFVKRIQEYADAGFTHIYLHQIGPDQDGFFDFWERELRPALGDIAASASSKR
jgi:G6PDH family F420-dependent oxidoreductase